jgi:hypothetical protein
MTFGRSFETALAAYFTREDSTAAFFQEWRKHQDASLTYKKNDSWDRLYQDQASRALTTLTVSYAAFALFLAALGLFGLLSQSVSRPTRELGIRMALGASRSDVVSMVVREGLVLTLAGVWPACLARFFPVVRSPRFSSASNQTILRSWWESQRCCSS